MSTRSSDAFVELQAELSRFYADPLGFVIFAYPWDSDPELQIVELPEPWRSRYGVKHGPDKWACELLERVGEKVRANAFDGQHAVEAVKEAIVSGHGIGKSCLVAWLVDWIMSTRPLAHGRVTAATAPQLSATTWPQIVRWTQKCITRDWWLLTSGKGSMAMRHKRAPEDWFCLALTCDEENSQAFAGQHALTSTSFYIFDESSAVPNKIKEVADWGMTDGEPMMFAFGNGTENSGWFFDIFNTREGADWGKHHVDSREVQITNKQMIDEEIAKHGIDSDRIKVRVRGMFPSMGVSQYIAVEDVDRAFGRQLRLEQYSFAPKVITVDPAWEGDDDLVIACRQGLHFRILRVIEKNDNDIQVANLVAQYEDDEQADGVLIDAGYGTGIYSAGKTMGRDWMLVWFGSKSPDPGFANMRAFMAGRARDWLKEGGAIPADHELRNEIIAVRTVPRGDGIVQLEAKKDAKRRGLSSPNKFDSLIISFAYPIQRKSAARTDEQRTVRVEHDPYSALERPSGGHDPYARMR